MTPLLLIPGTLCDARVFAPMLDGLAVTSLPTPPIAHADVAQAAQAVLDIAPPRFCAVGFSLGGFVVLELLRRAAERLTGAVLIASNAHPAQPSGVAARRAEVDLARRQGVGAVIKAVWPSYVAPDRIDDEALKAIVMAMAGDVGSDLFAKQAELAISRPDSRATVRETPVPLLGICGAADAMSSPERCGVFAGAPRGRVVELPGVGHFAPLEAPVAVREAMAAWLEELAPCF